MFRITISLPDHLKDELAEAAREQGRPEADLVCEGVERLLRSRREHPDVPLFARRIGPLAIEDDEAAAGEAGDRAST
ncbi:MAG TPA: hypothetical protein VI316_00460 [Candidatus Dormibacteraeota bacterium]